MVIFHSYVTVYQRVNPYESPLKSHYFARQQSVLEVSRPEMVGEQEAAPRSSATLTGAAPRTTVDFGAEDGSS